MAGRGLPFALLHSRIAVCIFRPRDCGHGGAHGPAAHAGRQQVRVVPEHAVKVEELAVQLPDALLAAVVKLVVAAGQQQQRLDDAAATLADDSALAGYHLFPSVRGDLLMKMGRLSEAREEIQRAIAMTKNLREQELLANRLKQLEKTGVS